VGFIRTNLKTGSQPVVRFNNRQAAVEPWIKEGKRPVKMMQSSGRRFLC
jgi:hypothetical protein